MAKGSNSKSIVVGKVRQSLKNFKEKRSLRMEASKAEAETPKAENKAGKPIVVGKVRQSSKELGVERALRMTAAAKPAPAPKPAAAKATKARKAGPKPIVVGKVEQSAKSVGQNRQLRMQAAAPVKPAAKVKRSAKADDTTNIHPVFAKTDYVAVTEKLEIQKVAAVASNVNRWVAGSHGGVFKIHPSGAFKFAAEDFAQKPAKRGRRSSVSFDVVGADNTVTRHRVSVHVAPGQVATGRRGHIAKLTSDAPQSTAKPRNKAKKPVKAETSLPAELFDVLDLSGATPPGGSFDVVYSGLSESGTGYEGTITYFDTDGGVVGTLDFTAVEEIMPCFTPGMMVKTARGDVAVENLKQGDMVQTKDNGFKPVRWVGSKHLTRFQLREKPALNPIRIQGSALGSKKPTRKILVSPQQRVLVENPRLKAKLGATEDLIPAQELIGLKGVEIAETRGVTYIHVMLDAHQTILVDGVWFESFQPGDASLAALDAEAREEIFELFPDLRELDGVTTYQPTRRGAKSIDAKAALAD